MSVSSSGSSSSLEGAQQHTAVPSSSSMPMLEFDSDEFYVRYNVTRPASLSSSSSSRRLAAIPGEFLEFELLPCGKLRYANNANYSREGMIRRECYLSPGVVDEFRKIIRSSGIVHVDDSNWLEPRHDEDDRQEIECRFGSTHIAFTTVEIKSVADIRGSPDPAGLQTFYFLAQDLKTLFHLLISSHFKARPFG